MKKKILFATVNMETGGIEKSLIGLLKKIDYKKYEVDLFLLKTNGIFVKDIPKEVTIITPYKSKTMERICNSNNILCKIIKHIFYNHFLAFLFKNKKKYDVSISYCGYYPFIDYYIKNTLADKKLIWVHTDISTFDGKLVYKIRHYFTKNKYKYFNNIVCVSESVKDCFDKFLPVFSNKTKILWNIVDIPAKKTKVSKLEGKYKIVSVGRLCYAKRFDKLIQVHKLLIDNNIDVNTYIVGDGELKSELKALINTLKLSDSIKLLGHQSNVVGLIKQANLFVLTSDYEGFGIVLLEALDSGIPFIGTNVTGIRDVANNIAPKNSCILVDNDIESIYEGIKKAINGECFKAFKFNIDDYNKKCLNDFYKLIK